MVGIEIIFGMVTLLASLPILAKYGIYYLYTPDIDIYFEDRTCPLFWSELESTGINFNNSDDKRYKIAYEIRINRGWEYDTEETNKQYHTQIREGWQTHRREQFGERDIILSKDTSQVQTQWGIPRFPLTPEEESAIVDILVFPRTELSEFGFPGFFPEIELKPVRKRCYITDDVNEFIEAHSDRQRLVHLYEILEGKLDNTEQNDLKDPDNFSK